MCDQPTPAPSTQSPMSQAPTPSATQAPDGSIPTKVPFPNEASSPPSGVPSNVPSEFVPAQESNAHSSTPSEALDGDRSTNGPSQMSAGPLSTPIESPSKQGTASPLSISVLSVSPADVPTGTMGSRLRRPVSHPPSL
jgi:hypothetical protein